MNDWERFKQEATGNRLAWDIDAAASAAYTVEWRRLMDSGDDGRWMVLDEAFWAAVTALREAGVRERGQVRNQAVAWHLYRQAMSGKVGA